MRDDSESRADVFTTSDKEQTPMRNAQSAAIGLLASAALSLSACGDQAPTKADAAAGATSTEPALDRPMAMQSGQYSARVQFLRFELPGLPPAAAAQMRQQMEQATAVEQSYCVTDTEARRSQEDRLREMSRAQGDCAFEQFDVDGTNITSRLQCTNMPGGGSATMVMAGTMAGTESDVRIVTTMTNAAVPQANATIEMRATTTRTGACTTPPNAGTPTGAQ